MRTKQIKIYEFKELSEDVQQKVLDTNRNYNVNDSWWYEHTIETWKEKLDYIGFENADIQFSHMYCQGEGASFTADIDIDKLFSYICYNESEIYTDINTYLKMIKLMEKGLVGFSFDIERNSSIYCHENTCRTNFELEIYLKKGSMEAEDWFYKEIDMFQDVIESIRKQFCIDIMYDLKKENEYQTEDEQIIASFEANDIEFTEDGTIY